MIKTLTLKDVTIAVDGGSNNIEVYPGTIHSQSLGELIGLEFTNNKRGVSQYVFHYMTIILEQDSDRTR